MQCLNHWDCCSNTCLSYLYKCSKIQKQTPALELQSAPALFAPAPIPAMQPDTVSFDALLEIVFRPLILAAKSGRELNAIESRLGEDKIEEYGTTTIYPTINPTINPTTDGPQCLEIGSKVSSKENSVFFGVSMEVSISVL